MLLRVNEIRYYSHLSGKRTEVPVVMRGTITAGGRAGIQIQECLVLNPMLSIAWHRRLETARILFLESHIAAPQRAWAPVSVWRVPAPGCGPCATHSPEGQVSFLSVPLCPSEDEPQGLLPVPRITHVRRLWGGSKILIPPAAWAP